MRLMLLSTGGKPYLEHALPEIDRFLGDRATIGFVTAADLEDELAYFASAQRALGRIGRTVLHVQWDRPETFDLERMDAVMVGGGNTYELRQRLQSGLFTKIHEGIQSGRLTYIGASAGSNLAGKNISCTNDWNVVEYPGPFTGFGFLPWTINPHFVSGPDPRTPRAETREERIAEYHRRHVNPVLSLDEGVVLRMENGMATISSSSGGAAHLFRRGAPPVHYSAGATISATA